MIPARLHCALSSSRARCHRGTACASCGHAAYRASRSELRLERTARNRLSNKQVGSSSGKDHHPSTSGSRGRVQPSRRSRTWCVARKIATLLLVTLLLLATDRPIVGSCVGGRKRRRAGQRGTEGSEVRVRTGEEEGAREKERRKER